MIIMSVYIKLYSGSEAADPANTKHLYNIYTMLDKLSSISNVAKYLILQVVGTL